MDVIYVIIDRRNFKLLVENWAWAKVDDAETYAISKYGKEYNDVVLIRSLIIKETFDSEIKKSITNANSTTTS